MVIQLDCITWQTPPSLSPCSQNEPEILCHQEDLGFQLFCKTRMRWNHQGSKGLCPGSERCLSKSRYTLALASIQTDPVSLRTQKRVNGLGGVNAGSRQTHNCFLALQRCGFYWLPSVRSPPSLENHPCPTQSARYWLRAPTEDTSPRPGQLEATRRQPWSAAGRRGEEAFPHQLGCKADERTAGAGAERGSPQGSQERQEVGSRHRDI